MKQTPNVEETVTKTHTQKTIAKPAVTQPRPGGASWQFYFVVAVIVLGVVGIAGKALGLF